MYEFMSFEDSLERKKIRGRVLNTLEFNKIREAVTARARTPYGRELCADMAPCCDFDYVTAELSCARQAMDQVKHRYLPEVIMSPDFETKWDEYLKAYRSCDTGVYFDELTAEIRRRAGK